MSQLYDFTQHINIGPTTAKNLQEMGIKDFSEMKRLGTEELFFRYLQHRGGWHRGMCSCWLYAIEGAITDTKWNEIPEQKRKRFRSIVHSITRKR